MSAAVVPDLLADVLPVAELGHVHLIGIGGAGMSAIARLLLARGVTVSGSDAKAGTVLESLAAQGATVFAGHRAEQVPASGTVVVTSAVRADNPELIAAQGASLRILHRSQALASLMLGRRGVAVAGTHGKTTTTGMITTALLRTGLDPSFAIGGELTDSGLGAAEGSTDIFVAEADESDGSFLLYRPFIAVITNIEPDHLDHYGSGEAVEAAFAAFARNVQNGGAVVACASDAGVTRVLAPLAAELAARGVTIVWYGTHAAKDVRVEDFLPAGDGSDFTLVDVLGSGAAASGTSAWDAAGSGVAAPGADASDGAGSGAAVPDGAASGAAGGVSYPVHLRVPGLHNALNSAATWAVATRLGPHTTDHAAAVAAALSEFGGTKRRFESKGIAGGVRVVDDYAHHPTEVAAVLAAARAVAGEGAVIAVFQPHLFSRTRIFAADFGAAFGAADQVVILDVYAAREDPEPGVTGALIAQQVPLPPSSVHFEPDASRVPALAASLARPGDLILTIGAGDVTALGPQILTALSEPATPSAAPSSAASTSDVPTSVDSSAPAVSALPKASSTPAASPTSASPAAASASPAQPSGGE